MKTYKTAVVMIVPTVTPALEPHAVIALIRMKQVPFTTSGEESSGESPDQTGIKILTTSHLLTTTTPAFTSPSL